MRLFHWTIAAVFGILFFCYHSYGQNSGNYGSREIGMAETSVNLAGGWSVLNNPGGIVSLSDFTTMAFYRSRYINAGLQDMAMAAVLPGNQLTYGLAVAFQGDDLLSTTLVSMVAANSMGQATIGLRANYYQVHLQGYGYMSAITLDLGGSFAISQSLKFSLVLKNLTQAKYSAESGKQLPFKTEVGLAYSPLPVLIFSIQTEKLTNEAWELKSGMEYKISNAVAIRTGFSAKSATAFGGFGWSFKSIIIDLAGSYHARLGYSGMMGIQYIFNK